MGPRDQTLGVCEDCGEARIVRYREGQLRPISGGDECPCGCRSFSVVEGRDVSTET